jgi:cell division protein ZapB
VNLLTEIRLHHYSGGMISEFHLLSEKIDQLAELAHSLRRENTDLRIYTAALVAENTALSKRMEEAHSRVSALLEKIPMSEQDSEQDEATA